MQSERTQGFTADPVYGRAKCLPMFGFLRTYTVKDLKAVAAERRRHDAVSAENSEECGVRREGEYNAE